jgi:hypothetical protein
MLIVWKQMCWQHFASKRLFLLKISPALSEIRLLGLAAGNKLHIDKRKWLRLDEESTFFCITASRKQACFEREDLTLHYHFCPHTPSALV